MFSQGDHVNFVFKSSPGSMYTSETPQAGVGVEMALDPESNQIKVKLGTDSCLQADHIGFRLFQ